MTSFTAYPKRLLIELTDRCNLKCSICVREEYEAAIGGPGRFLDLAEIKKLENAIRAADSVQINGFGETFLHPRLKDCLDYIYSVNPKDDLIKCVSNGTALSREKAGWLGRRLRSLHVSLNAANADSYSQEMHPHEYAAGKDVRFKFQRVLNNISDFMSGLDSDDQKKIFLHYVCHRDNFMFMADYVRLASELGISNVVFTPYKVNRPQFTEKCLYWFKTEYNEAADAALEAGEQHGVSVVARKFFSEAKVEYIPERDCRWVNEEAHVSHTGQVVVCCPSEFKMDGNCFSEGSSFETIWFGDQYNDLRRTRSLPACKVCNELATFDDVYTHFEHNIKLNEKFKSMISASIDASQRMEDLFEKFLRHHLDFEVYRRAAKSLDIDISAFASEPAESLFHLLEESIKTAFQTRIGTPLKGLTVKLSNPFLGYGWGGFQSNIHGQFWRWLNASGAERRSVLLLTLEPDQDYLVKTLIHTAPIDHYIKTLTVHANDFPALEQNVKVESGQFFHYARITAGMLADNAGRLRLAFDAGDPQRRRPGELGLALSSVTITPAA